MCAFWVTKSECETEMTFFRWKASGRVSAKTSGRVRPPSQQVAGARSLPLGRSDEPWPWLCDGETPTRLLRVMSAVCNLASSPHQTIKKWGDLILSIDTQFFYSTLCMRFTLPPSATIFCEIVQNSLCFVHSLQLFFHPFPVVARWGSMVRILWCAAIQCSRCSCRHRFFILLVAIIVREIQQELSRVGVFVLVLLVVVCGVVLLVWWCLFFTGQTNVRRSGFFG
mmetsp:Transcript_9938/g.22946  ORF Transcript_9938/g.22946 Transcript_9938/m.22946 type:complete len:225 (+) Transcript_9938:810-1484(+)